MCSKVLFSSFRDNWRTPRSVFASLDREFHFAIDLCADDENALCGMYFTKENSFLDLDFDYGVYCPDGCSSFCNPPYGRELYKIVKCCFESCCCTVMLLPARTDTRWFHDFCLNASEIRFIKGRLCFDDQKNSAPFPSMIVIFNKDKFVPEIGMKKNIFKEGLDDVEH